MLRRQIRPLALLVLMLGTYSVVSAQEVDVIGGTSNSATSNNFKGNCVRADEERILELIEFRLDFTTTMELGFYVYEAAQEFGSYEVIFEAQSTVTGIGDEWYSSGPLSITLQEGLYYIVGVSWPGSPTYFYNTGDFQDISFGQHVHGHAVGTHPMPPTVTRTSNDTAIYYQRLTTTDPAGAGPQFVRGDANDDTVFDISDTVYLLAALFIVGSEVPPCTDAGDINDDGALDISDAVYGLASLFIVGSAPPVAPFPDCGEDLSDDGIDCLSYTNCP